MTQFRKSSHRSKKMAIIAGYFEHESYGLLGPQMAATIIQDHTPYDCIVIAVPREYDKASLKKALYCTASGRDTRARFRSRLTIYQLIPAPRYDWLNESRCAFSPIWMGWFIDSIIT